MWTTHKMRFLLFFLSNLTTYSYFSSLNHSLLSPQGSPKVLSAQAIERELPQQLEDLTTLNILLLGFGGPGHEGGYLTDVIQLAHFDFKNHLLALISIPRDLWVTLPSGASNKANGTFLTDSKNQTDGKIFKADSTQSMVSVITGLPVDYFIAIDFVGFQRLIGKELGNIKVEVSETLSDPWYPVRGLELETCGLTPDEVAQLTAKFSGFELEKHFPCRYEHIRFDKGVVSMEGGDALAFVRSRHSSSDFDRSARQQAVITALKNRLLSLDLVDNLPDLFKKISRHVHTDLDLNILDYLAPALETVGDFKVININLSTDNVLSSSTANSGAFILVPKTGTNDWEAIHQYIDQQIN